MKRVDCERGCASFILSSLSFPLFFVRLQVLWGNWLHNQTFPNFEHFDARGGAVMMGGGEEGGGAAVTVGAEIFLYLDC